MMTAEQNAQFSAAAGATPSTLWGVISAIFFAFFMVWAIWVLAGIFRTWAAGGQNSFDMLWSFGRVTVLLSIVGVVLSNIF